MVSTSSGGGGCSYINSTSYLHKSDYETGVKSGDGLITISPVN